MNPPPDDAPAGRAVAAWGAVGRWGRRLGMAGGAGAATVLALLGAQNAALRWVVVPLINAQSDRLEVRTALAWSWWPGRVHVRGLSLRGQGLGDQWMITADRVSGQVSLRELSRRRFVASAITAEGVSARYRLRTGPANPLAPEIEGFPEVTGRARSPRWDVELSDIAAGVTEVWLEEVRFAGDARATGDVSLGRSVSATVTMAPTDGRLWIGDAPVASEIRGDWRVEVSAMPRRVSLGRDTLRALSGRVTMAARFEDLDFLEYYLDAAPWLSLQGEGPLRCDLQLIQGQFAEGSWLHASTDALTLGIGEYAVRGASQLSLEVTEDPFVPTRLDVGFRDFLISDPDDAVLVQGTGFLFSVITADVSLVDPFTSVDVTFDLPTSTIPDVAVFDRLLPNGLGFALTGGTGEISARVEGGSAEGAPATGRVDLSGRSVRATMDRLGVVLNLSVALPLSSGSLAEGVYGISGASVALSAVRLWDRDGDGSAPPMDPWWMTVNVVSGSLRVDERLSFSADMVLSAANAGPFLRVVSERRPIAPWIQRVLNVPDVRGRGRVSVSPGAFELADFTVTGGQAELQMRWVRRHQTDQGQIFARYGLLSVGVSVEGDEQRVRVFGARKWFEGEPTPTPADAEEPEASLTPRQLRRAARKLRRSE